MDGSEDMVAKLNAAGEILKKSISPFGKPGDMTAYQAARACWEAATALAERDATIERLTKERDEADRRAGAAERRNEDLQDSYSKRQSWLWKAKESEGFSQNGSFDDLWAKVRRERDEARAEVERKDAALTLIAEGRGVCETCGTLAKGPGPGVTDCDCRWPTWGPSDPQTIARAALQQSEEPK